MMSTRDEAAAHLLPGSAPSNGRRRNVLLVAGLLLIPAGMVALVAYAVPLYRLFCQVTGFGGTTRIATAAPGPAAAPPVTVRFDANVAPDMPWRFVAPQAMALPLGQEGQVAFTVLNLADEPILGTATFNVTPFKAGPYFDKIQCFCFTEQLLLPGERKELPVTFFVDPKITEDPDTRDVREITLSYTFFNKGRAARDAYLTTHSPAARVSGSSG
jgi:cytochrome c oxidase assembly protein subunit 11